MKKLLQLWLRGNKSFRLSTVTVNLIAHDLISIQPYIPSEFARRPRHLHEVDRWKATELRQFLLYTGMVVMNSRMSPIGYNHFLCLSIAIRIFIDPQLCMTFKKYAHSLLLYFVSQYGDMYGHQYLSHNVHYLIHLINDVQTFGSLENFSCFKYENFMQKIKNKLHQSGKPLEELSNRLREELQLPIQPCRMLQYPIVVYTKKNEISHIQYESFKIAISKTDNCALLYDTSVIFILNIYEENQNVFIRAKQFLNPDSLFSKPCDSKKLGIYVISNSSTFNIITIPITQIQKKCLKIIYRDQDNSYVTIPLLHINN